MFIIPPPPPFAVICLQFSEDINLNRLRNIQDVSRRRMPRFAKY